MSDSLLSVAEDYSIGWIYHSPVDGYVNYFHFAATTNKDAMIVCIQVCVWK